MGSQLDLGNGRLTGKVAHIGQLHHTRVYSKFNTIVASLYSKHFKLSIQQITRSVLKDCGQKCDEKRRDYNEQDVTMRPANKLSAHARRDL
jgi:hypothetical protein